MVRTYCCGPKKLTVVVPPTPCAIGAFSPAKFVKTGDGALANGLSGSASRPPAADSRPANSGLVNSEPKTDRLIMLEKYLSEPCSPGVVSDHSEAA